QTRADCRAGGKVFGHDLAIGRVHVGELRHVWQVDDAVDDMRPIVAGGLQRPADARQDFRRLRLDVALVRRGVARDAGDVQAVADLNRGAEIRVRRAGRAVRVR